MASLKEELDAAFEANRKAVKRIDEIQKVQFGLVDLLRNRAHELKKLDADLAELGSDFENWGEF